MQGNCTMERFMPWTFYHGDYKLYFGKVHAESWNADTDGKKAGAAIGFFALGVIMYALLFLYKLASIRMKTLQSLQKWGWLCVCCLIYFVHVGIGYLLMLAVMNFITSIFLATISGITLGKVLFGHVLKLPGKQEASCDELCH